jgi:hypothetical protein
MTFRRYDLPYDSYESWRAICPEGTYNTVTPNVLPSGLPQELLDKFARVVVMASGSPDGSVFVANGLRVDEPASSLDQEPYIIGFDHSASATSGGFVHHGKWGARTTKSGSAFFNAISASGITAYYPLAEAPFPPSGRLSDLAVASHRDAFWTSIKLLNEETEM